MARPPIRRDEPVKVTPAEPIQVLEVPEAPQEPLAAFTAFGVLRNGREFTTLQLQIEVGQDGTARVTSFVPLCEPGGKWEALVTLKRGIKGFWLPGQLLG